MSDTKKIVVLSVVIVFLAAAFFAGLSKSDSSYGMRAVKTVLLNPKYEGSIASVVILKSEEKLEFVKRNGCWYCKSGEITSFLNTNLLNEFIEALTEQRNVYHISDKSKSWGSYGLDAEDSLKLQLFDENSNPLQILYFGNNNFDTKSVYFRTEKTNTVYKTKDDFYSFLNTNIDFWADMQILPEGLFSLKNDSVIRIITDGKKLDNEQIDNYIKRLASMRFSHIVPKDAYDNLPIEKIIRIETNHGDIVLKFYQKNDAFGVIAESTRVNIHRYCGEISRWTMNIISGLE